MYTNPRIGLIKDGIRENLTEIRFFDFEYPIFRLLCLVRKTIDDIRELAVIFIKSLSKAV